MGEFGGTENLNPTYGRKTHIWFDLNHSFLTEPAYEFSRIANSMFLGSEQSRSDLMRILGWTVKPHQEDLSIMVERSESGPAFLTYPGTLMVAPGFTQTNLFRAPLTSEMPGVTTGASPSLNTVGYPGVKKSVNASLNWSDNKLSADETAYPAPPSGLYDYQDQTIPCDRVVVSKVNDDQYRMVSFHLLVRAKSLGSGKVFARFYFSGPATNDTQGVGTGQYCAAFTGNGYFYLLEKLDSGSWARRGKYSSPLTREGVSSWHSGGVFFSVYKSCAGFKDSNGHMVFTFEPLPVGITDYGKEGNALIDSLADAAISSINKTYNIGHILYRASGPKTPTINAPMRVDLRRDLMGSISISRATYPTHTITVRDAPFELPFQPTTSNDISYAWTVCKPEGTVVASRLMRADTETELTVVSSTSTGKVYSCPDDTRRFFVEFDITATATSAPELFGYRLQRNGVLLNPGEPSWEVGDASHLKSYIHKVAIKGAERDLSQESAHFTLIDPLDKLTELKARASMPVVIETEYDPGDTNKRCKLFRGLAELIHATRGRPSSSGYPVKGWNKFDVSAKGVWALVQENFIDVPYTHLHELTADGEIEGLPYKVTDFMKALLSKTGFDFSTEFEFPDLPTRIHVSPLDFSQTIDMLESVDKVVASYARDYLTHFLAFDPNLGTHGKWRLIAHPVAPYTNVAEFTFDGPTLSPGEHKPVHYPGSYGTGANGPIVPVVANTVKTWVKKPEANWLLVSSFGAWGSMSPQISTATIFNPISYNVNGASTADATHPDYLGRRVPMYVIDTALGSAQSEEKLKAAVNGLARRIARLTFHAIKMITFQAPLVLVDHELDPTKKRPLRYYDPVIINGVQFLVRNVNIDYRKDGFQYATYECEAPRTDYVAPAAAASGGFSGIVPGML